MSDVSTRKSISVIMPTFNSGSTIERALQSVKWVDEIIVVDMGSTDKTIKLAKKFGAKVFIRTPDDGNFDKNRKYGMQLATSAWILKLDSDEEITPKLAKEIKLFLTNDSGRLNGINLYNRVFAFGHEVKHGFVKTGSHELRMVRNGSWRYNPYKFHQQISVIGRTAFLSGKYIHHNFSDVSEFISKTNKYTTLDAKIMAANSEVSIIDILSAPQRSFIKLFFFQKGFLDGLLGFKLSFLFSIYNLIEKIKIYEFKKND